MMLIYSFAINQFSNKTDDETQPWFHDSDQKKQKESERGNDFFCGQEMFSGMEVELCREEQFVTGTWKWKGPFKTILNHLRTIKTVKIFLGPLKVKRAIKIILD